MQIVQTNPMIGLVANGARMVTDTKCESLQFSIQGEFFTADLRVLEVSGYDVILGLDWMTRFDPMKVNWGSRSISFNKEGREITLQVQEEKAEIKLCDGEIQLEKERRVERSQVSSPMESKKDRPAIYTSRLMLFCRLVIVGIGLKREPGCLPRFF